MACNRNIVHFSTSGFIAVLFCQGVLLNALSPERRSKAVPAEPSARKLIEVKGMMPDDVP